MRVLINGLGCPYTGAKFILDQILKSTPVHVQVTAIIPIVKNSIPVKFPNSISVIKLRHSIWGMYLRVFLELYLNLLMWLRKYDLLINLSNYGLCFSKGQVLYIHSPLLMDMSAPTGFGQGNPNILVRLALNTCLENAECIFLQTGHMSHQLRDYCKINKLTFPRDVKVIRPPFPVIPANDSPIAVSKTYEVQFFYPSSHFPHKRTDLAIQGILQARKSNEKIGLNLTIDSIEPINGITFLGLIGRERVYEQLKTSDALLFTSERETLGLPLLEALYFEKPAVLPNKAYAREIYGDAGVYYDEDTPESVCRAILFLIDHYAIHAALAKERKFTDQKTEYSWSRHWDLFLAHRLGT